MNRALPWGDAKSVKHTHINKSEEVCDTWYTQVKALDLRYF